MINMAIKTLVTLELPFFVLLFFFFLNKLQIIF